MPYTKLKWVLAIIMIFGLVLATNLIDRKNFQGLKDSMVSIYEDRLVVKNIIYQLSNGVHQKELALSRKDSSFFGQTATTINSQFEELIDEFENTKLTKKEQATLNKFKESYSTLKEIEGNLWQSSQDQKEYARLISRSKDELDQLADIQMTEGKREFFHGKRRGDSIEFFTQIEIFVLIILAVLAQIIILYSPKPKK